MTTEDSKKDLNQNTKSAVARLMAVQASYEISQNGRAVDTVIQDYLGSRTEMEIDGEKLVQPDGALFKKILEGVRTRKSDIEALLEGHHNKEEGSKKTIEPLLEAVLQCGTYEILAQDTDIPIIINDYLNVTHAFYDKGEVTLVNGILDRIAKSLA